MSLRQEIEKRWNTVHRFCRLHPQLNRSTVYQVVRGTYGGNMERQAKRIRDVLEGTDDETRVFEAIKERACARCNVNTVCSRCDTTFRIAARAATEFFSN
jgi:hypothetical protein